MVKILLFLARTEEDSGKPGRRKELMEAKVALSRSLSPREKSPFLPSKAETSYLPIFPHRTRTELAIVRGWKPRERRERGRDNGERGEQRPIGKHQRCWSFPPLAKPFAIAARPLSSSSAFRTVDRPWARDQTSAQIPRRPGG